MALFQYDFMVRAFIACGAIACFAPVLGLLLILRKQSLMSDTLAHVSLAGVALGFLLGVEPIYTTILVVVIAAMALEYLRRVYKNYSDISIAMLMSGGMALALLLMSRVESASSIEAYLFGSIVTISSVQVRLLIALAVIVLLAYFVFKRVLYVEAFDESIAYTSGLPTRLISMVLSIVTGVAISIMMPIAGTLLVSSILIMPAAIAMRLMKSFDSVIILAIIIALAGMFSGLLISYGLDTPPGATIAFIFVCLFALESIVLRLVKR